MTRFSRLARPLHFLVCAVLVVGACNEAEFGGPIRALRPRVVPGEEPALEVRDGGEAPVPVVEPDPLDLALERFASWEPDDLQTAAFVLLAIDGAGETYERRSLVRRVRRFLIAEQGEDFSFGAGDAASEILAAIAILDHHAFTRSPFLDGPARGAANRLSFPRDAAPAQGGLGVLALLHRRDLGKADAREDVAAVREWIDGGWEDALREGGMALAARALARLVLGESPRKSSTLSEALDLLLKAGPPVRNGTVEDPLLLFIGDKIF